MTSSPADARYTELVAAFLERPNVHQDGQGFGSSALKVKGRIFAMLSSRGEFVVKLPRKRVDELVAAGDGARYDAGKGRPMKEWLAVAPTASIDWAALASEALAFVGGA